jgi:urea transport system permease protein
MTATTDAPTLDTPPPEEAARPAPVAVSTGLNPWVFRVGIVVFAVLLSVWPSIVGDPTRTRQWAEYLCLAIVAIGIDIAWGYGGMLVLGQGVFFGLGAYAMGMYLTLEQVGPGEMPQFMTLYSDFDSLPWMWAPFQHLWFAAAAAVVVPMVVAGLLGWLVFSRRIRGPYFALLTQATALIFWLLLVGQLQLTAGTNGLTNFVTIFGRSRYDSSTIDLLYWMAAGGLLVAIVLGRQVVRSRFGRLLMATRDGEDRVRFLGYDPARVKTVAFVLAAGLAGAAGALVAPILGIVAPDQFAVVPSILMITWVAIGGRGTLYGAVIGALLVGRAETSFAENRPDDWLYLQGILFVVVIAYAPGGLLGLVRSARSLVERRRAGGDAGRPAALEQASDAVPDTLEVAT